MAFDLDKFKENRRKMKWAGWSIIAGGFLMLIVDLTTRFPTEKPAEFLYFWLAISAIGVTFVSLAQRLPIQEVFEIARDNDGEISFEELRHLLNVTPETVSRIMRQLTKKGYARVEVRGGKDSYKVLVFPTVKGSRREFELDKLDRALESDNDPKTTQAVNSLRTILREFRVLNEKNEVSGEVLAAAEDAYNDCIKLLRKSLELDSSANENINENLKAIILQKRENVVNNVLTKIDNLIKFLNTIYKIDSADKPDKMVKLEEDFIQQVKIQKAVDERLESDGINIKEIRNSEEMEKP